jgi:hypothetical protein
MFLLSQISLLILTIVHVFLNVNILLVYSTVYLLFLTGVNNR